MLLAAALLPVSDIAVATVDPWGELGRMAWGFVTPDFAGVDDLAGSFARTLAFAFLGMGTAAVTGFGLSLAFDCRVVRVGCALVRAVHELFWALIFLQIFGLSPLTGLLAIAVPYSGIVAKVFAEIADETPSSAPQTLSPETGRLSAYLYGRLPDLWPHFKAYASYRLECGLRSAAILGFVGLPTIGFHLEGAFKQGDYAQAAALLIVFYVLIATMRVWLRRELLPFYVIGALFVLPWGAHFEVANIVRFLTHDIVPAPLRDGALADPATWGALGDWLWMLAATQIWPGAIATLKVTMIALAGAGVLAMAWFPLVSPQFLSPLPRTLAHVVLVVIRSTPEYILAFILLTLWGPSMLPAIVALSLHNGAIVGHLVGRHTGAIRLRDDAAHGLARYAYEIVPRSFRQLLAYLFYRWEVILRETAIFGILGIATLGFYVDSAFAELRFDRAMVLIAATALLNLAVDAASRAIRARLRLTAHVGPVAGATACSTATRPVR